MQVDPFEFNARLIYIVSYRTAKTAEKDPVSKAKTAATKPLFIMS